MIDLDETAARLTGRFGPGIRAWCAALPERVERLAADWALDVGSAYPTGNSSVAFRCHGPDGPAVLKMFPDHAFATEQARTLRLFAATGRVPAVLAEAAGAVLMAAIEPGLPVAERAGRPSVPEFAGLLRDLHVGIPNEGVPRDLCQWTGEFLTAIRRRLADPAVSGRVTENDLRRAERLRDRLLATPGSPVLLHGDLHFGNVLDGGARGLVAIDPKACRGDRCFDAVDCVLDAADRTEIARLRDGLAAAAALDAERLDAWCRVCAPVTAIVSFRRGNTDHGAELMAFARS